MLVGVASTIKERVDHPDDVFLNPDNVDLNPFVRRRLTHSWHASVYIFVARSTLSADTVMSVIMPTMRFLTIRTRSWFVLLVVVIRGIEDNVFTFL